MKILVYTPNSFLQTKQVNLSREYKISSSDKRPFYPELIQVHSNETDNENEAKFSVLERRLLRNARNSLIRVADMENSKKLGLLGDNALNLVKEFDEILSGKNF